MIDRELFRPKSIAILGASSEPGRLAHRPLSYLERAGYSGAVYPINPRRGTIGNLRCYPDLGSVTGPIDAALVSLAAPQVQPALRECADRGIRLAVVLSAGLSADLEAPAGLTVMGPNSMGFVDAHARVAATWNSALDVGEIRAGNVALVAQSGGLGGAVLNRLLDRGVGISCTFFTGEERFLDSCDLIEFLLNDPKTEVIVLLLEGLRQPIKFVELARRARARGVPIIAYKLAKSARATRAALGHTGMLAGERRVQRAVFRQLGIVEADALDDLVDLGVLFSARTGPIGGRVAAVSTSGGACILFVDQCDEFGLDLPELAETTADGLRRILPTYAEIANPLDITAGLAESALLESMKLLSDDPSVDVVIPINTMIGGSEKLIERARGLVRLRDTLKKPVLSCWLGGSLSHGGLNIMRETGDPFFHSIEACLRALTAHRDYHDRRSQWISH